MDTIKNIIARQILDSRGNPTIEVEIHTNNNITATASIPSGASIGTHEAIELRDLDDSLYAGKSVLKAINNIHKVLHPLLVGTNIFEQERIDLKMLEADGTNNKKNLGANAILGVSLALAKVAAKSKGKYLYQNLNIYSEDKYYLPMPLINIINGGAHADNNVDIQEFMIVPVGATSFSDSLRMGFDVFRSLAEILKKKSYSTNVGDEGGYAPNLQSNEEAIEHILTAINKAGYIPGKDISLAIDSAASEFFNKKTLTYKFKNDKNAKSTTEIIEMWLEWTKKYHIVSIEDPLTEDDWEGWVNLTSKMKKQNPKIQIVGDDIFATNIERLKKGIKSDSANAILIKMNQIGTVSETIEVIKYAQKHNFKTIISHRSGETEDTSIADLSVAFNCRQIKTGSMSRTDRVAKYNQLIRIEERLGKNALWENPFE